MLEQCWCMPVADLGGGVLGFHATPPFRPDLYSLIAMYRKPQTVSEANRLEHIMLFF